MKSTSLPFLALSCSLKRYKATEYLRITDLRSTYYLIRGPKAICCPGLRNGKLLVHDDGGSPDASVS